MTTSTSESPSSLSRILLRDLGGVVFLAIVSLVAGVILNRLHASPLSLVYQTPEQRLTAELTTLVEAPPFQLSQIDTISLDEFQRLLKDGQALVLDARAAPFYQQGHIPGAVNLARDEFAVDYRKLRPTLDASKDKPVVVYCSGGDCHDSRMVASALLSLGFSQVRVFTDGWDGWTRAGLPVAQ
jgi:rhodanese-related sulfurtransferase